MRQAEANAQAYQDQASGVFVRQAHESQRPDADRPELGGPLHDPGVDGNPVGQGQK